MEDLPRQFTIRESSHRIHNPLTPEKLAAHSGRHCGCRRGRIDIRLRVRGDAVHLGARPRIARRVSVGGVFTGSARERARELGVRDIITSCTATLRATCAGTARVTACSAAWSRGRGRRDRRTAAAGVSEGSC